VELVHHEAALLPLALGLLSSEHQAVVQAHLRSCARCTNLAAQVKDELAQLALALPPAPAPALLREGLSHALGEVSRFTAYIDDVAQLLQLSRMQAETLLFSLDHEGNWSRASLIGTRLWRLRGPGEPCFMRIDPGYPVLSPRARGADAVMVLQGRCRDARGTVYAPGMRMRLQVQGEPHYAVVTGVEFICLLKDETASLAQRGRQNVVPARRPGKASAIPTASATSAISAASATSAVSAAPAISAASTPSESAAARP
jgi:anti-sigma factor ChrR (cupin superfamily)